MKENFDKTLDKFDFWYALNKIETNIGKGRFSQRLASQMTEDMIPSYVKRAIVSIVDKVKSNHE